MVHPIPETVALFGLPITNVTMAQAVTRVEEQIRSGNTHQIATANLDFARNSLKDPYLQRVICDCSMVLPDGAPMLWASSLFGAPLKQRVTGVDLIPELARLSAERGYRIFLLGSSEKSSRMASEVLTSRYPGVQIVRHCPDVAPLHAMDNEDLLRRIAIAEPDILLVAFGNPKQEMWIHRHRDRLTVPVSIGIGGALDMIAGSLKRAPKWVQRLNLEWAYRMLQEPKRLFPRYFHDAVAFFVHLPLGLLATRMQPGGPREGTLKVDVQGTVRIISTPSKLCGEISLWLAHEARAASEAGHTLIVDMSATIRVEADGLGGLLEARRIMIGNGLWIWLTGMSNPVRRVLQFSAMSDLFRVATTASEALQYTRAANSLSPRGADPNSSTISSGKNNVQSASIARAS